MSTKAGLLSAIREKPDEDTPRLAFADWLDEHADEIDFYADWADLIRKQIEFRGLLSTGKRDIGRIGLRVRELLEGPVGKMFAENLRASRGDQRPPFSVFTEGCIDRGFPQTLKPCMTRWWVGHGDVILSRLPIAFVSLWTIPVCEETEAGVLIQGDPQAQPVTPTERVDGEHRCLAVLRKRWRGVRFEFLQAVQEPADRAITGLYPTGQPSPARKGRVGRVGRIGRV